MASFRNEWEKSGKKWHKISGTNYFNKTNVLNEYIKTNRINLSGNGFRSNKNAFIGELGCYDSHYNCWKYVVDNELNSCLILEDGIHFLRHDFQNMVLNKKLDLLFVNEEMRTNTNTNTFDGYGTQGYIISLQGAKKLLKLCETLSAPIDLQIRHLCNTKDINAATINHPFVKRKNNRISTIENCTTDENDLNAKQCPHSIIQRIIMSLLANNINLDDYIQFS